MLIPVTVTLQPGDDYPGAKLWICAEDGSKRAWFKWYESEAIAKIDAHKMRL
jgi:hypothetical protein